MNLKDKDSHHSFPPNHGSVELFFEALDELFVYGRYIYIYNIIFKKTNIYIYIFFFKHLKWNNPFLTFGTSM